MNDAYTLGFIDKCAQVGVDPEALVEAAKNVEAATSPTVSDRILGSAAGGVGGGIAGGAVGAGLGKLISAIKASKLENQIAQTAQELENLRKTPAMLIGAPWLRVAKIGGIKAVFARLLNALRLTKPVENSNKYLWQFAETKRKLDELHRMRSMLAGFPRFGLVRLGALGAGLGAVAGGAKGWKYLTQNAKNNVNIQNQNKSRSVNNE